MILTQVIYMIKVYLKDSKSKTPIFLSLETMEFVIPDSIKKEYYMAGNRFPFNKFYSLRKHELLITPNDNFLSAYLEDKYPEVFI